MNANVTPEEEARYTQLAERMEAGDFGPVDVAIAATHGGATRELHELLAQADGVVVDTAVPTPAAVVGGEAASDEQVRNLVALGRPSLSGTHRKGESPKRQVRLPHHLDAALTMRAQAEHRSPSDVMRDAIARYVNTP